MNAVCGGLARAYFSPAGNSYRCLLGQRRRRDGVAAHNVNPSEMRWLCRARRSGQRETGTIGLSTERWMYSPREIDHRIRGQGLSIKRRTTRIIRWCVNEQRRIPSPDLRSFIDAWPGALAGSEHSFGFLQ
jgi:hypothetical protein